MNEIGFLQILLIALGLSADCFAVALGISICLKRVPFKVFVRTCIAFGVFQAVMLIIGWLVGSTVIDYIQTFAHWLAFGLLGFIGGKMIWESFHEDEAEEKKRAGIARWSVLITLSIATSIDSLAVGLSFAFLNVNIMMASITIGTTALLVTALGLVIGRKVGEVAGSRAEIIGGVVLIGIGIKILLEHLL